MKTILEILHLISFALGVVFLERSMDFGWADLLGWILFLIIWFMFVWGLIGVIKDNK